MLSGLSSVVLTECFFHEGQTFTFPKRDPSPPPKTRSRDRDLPSLRDVRDVRDVRDAFPRSRSRSARSRSSLRRHRSVGPRHCRYRGRSRRSRAHRRLLSRSPSQSQRALIRKIPQTSRETPRETPQTPLAIEDSERKTNPLDDDPDRLMEQALIHSFSINTGKLRGESKVYFQLLGSSWI